jgi:hypothetical protein
VSAEGSQIRFSRGRDKFDSRPEIRQADDFHGFAAAVLRDRSKAKGKAWIAAPFNGDGRRCRENAQARRFLPVDLDKIDPDRLAELRLWFAKFKGFGYPTASSTAEAPRERVILELTREATRDENLRIGAALVRDLQEEFAGAVVADESVFRNEQPVYTPPVDVQPFFFTGEPLDVDVWLETAPELAEAPRQAVAEGDHILDGARNKTLASLAGTMRKRGMTQESIKAALLAENALRCNPPLPADEVGSIAESIGRYAPAKAKSPASLAGDVPDYLASVHSARDIMATPQRPVDYCVPNKVPSGLVMLAGRPKARKSWAALQIGIARATGGETLGAKCEPCRVLYLALEDNDHRMRVRLEFFGLTPETAPEKLHFVYTWRQGAFGVGDLEEWLRRFPDTGLVIVDVLQKFRGAKDVRQAQYEADYAMLSMLHRLAAERPGLTVLVVHHVKKGGTADPIESLSGTFGIAGAADAMIVLTKRMDNERWAVHIDGRDWESFDHDFVWEFRDGVGWHWLGALDTDDLTDRQAEIVALAKSDGLVTPTELASKFGISKQAAAESLRRLVAKQVLYAEHGKYRPLA